MRFSAPTLIMLLGLGCGKASAPEVNPPIEGKSLTERMADDPIGWQPGDREPVARTIEPWESHRCTRETGPCPIEWGTTVRNRCLDPVRIQVGPGVASPPNTAPSHTIAAGEAIWWLKSSEHHIYVADHDGHPYKRPPADATSIVISGDACEQMVWE